MIEDIIKLREDGLSFRKIATKLNTTVGKVQYRWNKWNANQEKNYETNSEDNLSGETSLKEIVQLKGEMQAKITSPNRILLFWEVSEIPQKLVQYHFNKRFDEFVQVIRVYDVTDIYFTGNNAHHFYEIAVPYQNGYWFIKGLTTSRSYVAELGVKLNQSHFFPLFRSNSVQVPSLSQSQKNELHYELTQTRHLEENTPKWIDYVSTYTYYDISTIQEQNDKND